MDLCVTMLICCFDIWFRLMVGFDVGCWICCLVGCLFDLGLTWWFGSWLAGCVDLCFCGDL